MFAGFCFLNLAEGIAAYKSTVMYGAFIHMQCIFAHPWIFSNIATAIFSYKRRISIAMLELPKENMDSFGVFCVMPCCHAPVQLVVSCICAHSQLHLIIACVGTKPFFKIIFFHGNRWQCFPSKKWFSDPKPLSLRLPR